MADIAPTNVWPELDGRRAGGISQLVLFQRFSSDESYRLTSSSSAATHWMVTQSSSELGPQPYLGSSSLMVLKGAHSHLLQIQQSSADTTFWYHADVWLSTDGSGNVVLAATSSDEAMYFGSSSSTAVFTLSTTQASTSVLIGTQQPSSVRGVRIWEAVVT